MARNPADMMNPLVFFVIVISLFPLGISPSEDVLSEIAPGVIWVAALLATLLSMEMMFKSDFDDGSLEQMTLSAEPLYLIVTGKIISHWIVSGLPLTLLSPLLGVMLFVNESGLIALIISLCIATPILSLLGAIGASLTVGLKQGAVLISCGECGGEAPTRAQREFPRSIGIGALPRAQILGRRCVWCVSDRIREPLATRER